MDVVIETAGVALATLFATISPVDTAAMYAALAAENTAEQRRSMAVRGIIVATIILLLFALFGEALLVRLGISLAAWRTAGGILLLLIAIDMVFARESGGTSTTEAEATEAANKQDIAVFPLATPLIAGPGAMGAVILLMADAQGDVVAQATVVGCLLAILLLTLLLLLGATRVQKYVGVTGLHVLNRVFGVVLAALAVQFIFEGIAQSGLFSSVLGG
ncbi:MAG TPA: MarC family protein [Anaerolineae bacterium]|nr:MarC family protein [Anaerolineae bacterium]